MARNTELIKEAFKNLIDNNDTHMLALLESAYIGHFSMDQACVIHILNEENEIPSIIWDSVNFDILTPRIMQRRMISRSGNKYFTFANLNIKELT